MRVCVCNDCVCAMKHSKLKIKQIEVYLIVWSVCTYYMLCVLYVVVAIAIYVQCSVHAC